MDRDEQNDFNALLSLYGEVCKRLDYYEGKSNNDYLSFFAVMSFIAASTYYINQLIITGWAMPFISALAFYRFAFFTRFTAYLRGYAASIETEINGILKKNYFLDNSILISKFIGPKNFKTNRTSGYLCIVGMIIPTIISFYALCRFYRETPRILIGVGLYAFLYIACLAVFVSDSFHNDRTRELSQKITTETFNGSVGE